MLQGKADRGEAAARPKHVWSIRTKLQIEGREPAGIRQEAMRNPSAVLSTSSRRKPMLERKESKMEMLSTVSKADIVTVIR